MMYLYILIGHCVYKYNWEVQSGVLSTTSLALTQHRKSAIL